MFGSKRMGRRLTEVPSLKDNDAQRVMQCRIISKQLGEMIRDGDTGHSRADDAYVPIGSERTSATCSSKRIYARRAIHPERVRRIGHGKRFGLWRWREDGLKLVL
jgi:hypothetical protein